MLDLPNILPADPAAPEHHRQPQHRLKYGALARLILQPGRRN